MPLSSTTLLPFTFSRLPSPALAQATDPRKEEADQFLKLCREQWQQQQYEAAVQACQEAFPGMSIFTIQQLVDA